MVRMWRGCVRPINRTNGGLTAPRALREEDPPVAAAAAAGWAERTGGARRGRGQKKKENPRQAAAVGYSRPSGSYSSPRIYSYIREGGRRKEERLRMTLNKSTHTGK